jgi:hypothetical protein
MSVQTAPAEEDAGKTGPNRGVAALIRPVKGPDDVSLVIELIAA